MTLNRPILNPALLLLALLVPAFPALAAAQAPPAQQAFSVGPRFGYDFEVSNGALVAGVGTRLSVPGIRGLELQGVADWTFLNGLTERQAGLDLLYRFGGITLGGGPAWRSTIWDVSSGRETRTGYSGVVIFGGQTGRSRLNTQLELRFTKVSIFSPKMFSIGVNFPLVRF